MAKKDKNAHVSETPATQLLRAQGVEFTEHPYDYVEHGGSAESARQLGLDEHMVAVPITPPLEMTIVGSPEYFERYGMPETPADLMKHNCLAYRFTSSGTIDRWSFTSPDEEKRTVVFEPQGNAVFNDDDSMLRATLQGVGLVQHIDLCVRRHLAAGVLRACLSRSWQQRTDDSHVRCTTDGRTARLAHRRRRKKTHR